MTDRKLSLDEAYAIKSPDDAERFYADQAEDYDSGFAAERGYVYPQHVAEAFRSAATDANWPVLDIGAGTGLVAEHIDGEVDGIDISAEMLACAGRKGLYRNRIRADLTRPLDLADASYGGFVSAGTFTHGHVGSEVLPELMRIARPGALFAIGINPKAFDEAGFGSAFAELVADGWITPLEFHRVRIYEREDHEHGRDTALIARFRRTGQG